MAENLRIAHLNIRSLRNKIPDIHHILTRDDIHVLALTETHLNKNVRNFELKIDNYKLYRKDRNNGEGKGRWGVALYVQDHIPVRKHNIPHLSDIQMIWVEIYLPHTKPLLIGCCYRPPRSRRVYLDRICESIQELSRTSDTKKDIFLLGDFNMDWFSEKRKINNFAQRCGLNQIVNEYTRLKKCIDHIYTNIPELYDTPTTTFTRCSDHNLVILTVERINVHPQKIMQRSETEFDNDKFIGDINRAQWNAVIQESEPENALLRFVNIFLEIAERHAPLEITTTTTAHPWWNEEPLFLNNLILKRDQTKNIEKARKYHKEILNKFSYSKVDHFHPESEQLDIPTNIFNVFYQYYTDRTMGFIREDLLFIKFLTESRLSRNENFSLSRAAAANANVTNLLAFLSDSVTPGRETDGRLLNIAAQHISDPIRHILNRCIDQRVIQPQ